MFGRSPIIRSGQHVIVEPHLLAGHELQRAVGAEVQHRVRPKVLAQPAIAGGEGVRRREFAIEEQPHRVALDPKPGWKPTKTLPNCSPEHQELAAIGELRPGRAPDALDVGEVGLAAPRDHRR
jgi:hypothetical protein